MNSNVVFVSILVFVVASLAFASIAYSGRAQLRTIVLGNRVSNIDGNGVLTTMSTAKCPSLIPGFVSQTEQGNLTFEVLDVSPKFNITDATKTGSNGSYGVVSSGVVTLSSGQTATVPWNQTKLGGGYRLPVGAGLVSCGISYCSGEGCSSLTSLPTTNVELTSNYTKSFCTIEICYTPHVDTSLSITAESPVLKPGIPHTFVFQLTDNLGDKVSWTFTLTYK